MIDGTIYILTFSHPDCTVGFGIAPNLSFAAQWRY
jgi:hypothetical protein